jgi:hypothetical protein
MTTSPTTERQAEAALADVVADLDTPTEVDLHEDRTREVRTPGFSRMRTEWDGPDAVTVAQVQGIVQNRIMVRFASAYAIMNELYEIVRDPVVANIETGELRTDDFGFPLWQTTSSGSYVEDYSRLTHKDRENLLFQITTNLFAWEQAAAEAWGEAMFAKAQFEERFALTFAEAPGGRPTEADRTNFARTSAREERYFAIFQSLYSRRADAIVRTMTLLGQRLRDVMK